LFGDGVPEDRFRLAAQAQVAGMTGADLNAIEEHLLAQMTAMKPPVMRLIAMLARVDSWIAVRINERQR
jgi:hypothetical protein